MNVTISVGGRFHAFDLARELDRHGALHKLLTSYPRRIAQTHGVPAERVQSFVASEVFKRVARRGPTWFEDRVQPTINEQFARWAERQVPADTDLFVGWSGFSAQAMERAKGFGAKTVLERGSAHIEVQEELLLRAYEGSPVRPRLPHPRVIAKELEEYESADRIAVPSRFVLNSFLERGFSEDRFLVNPYGVRLDQFSPGEPGERDPDGPFRVLFVGLACRRKGVHDLLQAFERAELPEGSEIWFAGRVLPEVEDELMRFSDRKLQLFGSLPQAELVHLYRQASLFVLPSYEEGMAMVVPQAMACGLPCLVSENSGCAELIRETRAGEVIPPGDVEALAAELTWFAEHVPERVAMGERAAQRVTAGLTWADYGDRAVELYRELLRAEPAAPLEVAA
ncbi:MAG: glycosyltransferase family 4 protein [Planctomycetota bacterium]